jgi:hypothetical protein
MLDRIIIVAGFVYMTTGLIFIAWQNVKIAQLVTELGALIARTHP